MFFQIKPRMGSTLWIAFILSWRICSVRSDLHVLRHCHYDPDPPPEDGILQIDMFPWMAVLEYLNLETGLRYPSRVPRVSLIHERFGLTTASAAAAVPEGYALGNIVIVEYVRDEVSCGVTLNEAMRGVGCPRASFVIPVADVVLHPEYSSFGAPESLALLKLMQPVESTYLMPICLPSGGVWTYDMRVEKVYLLDFLSVTPEDYEKERKGVKRLHVIPPNTCDSFQETLNISSAWRQRTLCTSGCGMRAGASLVAHDQRMRVGYYWHLVGVAVGGPLCEEPAARHRRNKAPPRFVYVWPYVDWIVQVMTSHDIPFPLPRRAFLRQRRTDTHLTKRWEGRWYLEGKECHYNSHISTSWFLFYEEFFSVRAISKSFLRYNLQLRNDINYTVVCMKILMPNNFLTPNVTYDPMNNVTVWIPLVRFPRRYDLRVQAWGTKATPEEAEERRKYYKNLDQMTPSSRRLF